MVWCLSLLWADPRTVGLQAFSPPLLLTPFAPAARESAPYARPCSMPGVLSPMRRKLRGAVTEMIPPGGHWRRAMHNEPCSTCPAGNSRLISAPPWSSGDPGRLSRGAAQGQDLSCFLQLPGLLKPQQPAHNGENPWSCLVQQACAMSRSAGRSPELGAWLPR